MVEPSETLPLGLTDLDAVEAEMDDRGKRHLQLRQLDRVGFQPIYVLTCEPDEVEQTFAAPVKVVCSDGQMYWLKARAQDGLLSEIATARLNKRLGTGPEGRIVEVPASVFWNEPRLGRFIHSSVGVRHLPETASTREIRALLGRGRFDARLVDAESRARVIASQTWFNIDDAQVRVGLRDGRVHSVDHGAALDARLKGRPTRIVVTEIPGVSPDLGRDWSVMRPAIELIESVSEAEILAAVSSMPNDGSWRATFARRIAVAEWLIRRQKNIGEVMQAWSLRLS